MRSGEAQTRASPAKIRILNIVNNPIPILMTAKEFAAHRGVKPSAVSNWKKKKLLVFAEDPAGGKPKIHVERTEQRLATNIDPGRGRPTSAQAAAPAQPSLPEAPRPADGAGRVADVRTDLIVAQTVQMNLKNAKVAGELVPLAEFESRAGEYGRLVRERVQAMFRTVSERLAAESDPRKIVALLSDEADATLSDLAKSITGAPPPPADDEETLEAEIAASEEAAEA